MCGAPHQDVTETTPIVFIEQAVSIPAAMPTYASEMIPGFLL